MSSIGSLGRMVSGLKASQKGLQVTSHNLSNMNTTGYVRQQLLQHESSYLNIGTSSTNLMQVGLGVTPTEIRQIRDELADKRYRTESAVLNFYQTRNSGINEIENILDEPHGESISKMLNNFWSQAQKLNTNPDGVEERLSFIQSANVLIKKANNISNSFKDYQDNLNREVIAATERINEIIKGVKDLNEKIAINEINGDNANDYRDQRNLLLDELSGYGEISYYEEADSRINLKFEGQVVVDKQFVTTLDLKQTVEGSPFVKPVWSNTKEDIYKFDKVVSATKENDTGKLKALLITRGNEYVNTDTDWSELAFNQNLSVDEPGNSFLVPKIHKKLNQFIDEIVSLVNESFNGDGIGSHKGVEGVPVFVPIKTPADPVAPKAEDYTDEALYIKDYKAYLADPRVQAYMTPGNLQINPELLNNGGYNKLGTVQSKTNNIGDNSIVTDFLGKWNETRDWPCTQGELKPTSPHYKKVNIMSYYAELVTDLGIEGSNFASKTKEKLTTVNNIDNERQSMSGVSQDEEFTSMLKYQYAYNASARMITMLDGMMDTIINRM